MTNNLNAIFKELDRQDLHAVVKGGIPTEIEMYIKSLCEVYRRAESDSKNEMRSAVTRNATVVLLAFVSAMATLAMQRKDVGSLDLALLAFDLSNIMRIDFRDAFTHVAQLAFAATECGVKLDDHARTIIPDISSQLLEMFGHSKPPRVRRDSEGKLIFWKS
jgi:hypothetical protein